MRVDHKRWRAICGTPVQAIWDHKKPQGWQGAREGQNLPQKWPKFFFGELQRPLYWSKTPETDPNRSHHLPLIDFNQYFKTSRYFWNCFKISDRLAETEVLGLCFPLEGSSGHMWLRIVSEVTSLWHNFVNSKLLLKVVSPINSSWHDKRFTELRILLVPWLHIVNTIIKWVLACKLSNSICVIILVLCCRHHLLFVTRLHKSYLGWCRVSAEGPPRDTKKKKGGVESPQRIHPIQLLQKEHGTSHSQTCRGGWPGDWQQIVEIYYTKTRLCRRTWSRKS